MIAALVGFFRWKAEQGITGTVKPLPLATQDRLAFVRQDDKGETHIFVIKADGTDERQLTEGKSARQSPAWSPDGKLLCCLEEKRENGTSTYQVVLLGVDGTTQITQNSSAKTMPQFRPDGKMIAYLSGGSVKVVGTTGKESEQVYPPPHRSSGASQNGGSEDKDEDGLKTAPIVEYRWSPSGQSMLLVQENEGEYAITTGVGGWYDKDKPSGSAPSRTIPPQTVTVLKAVGESLFYPLTNAGGTQTGIAWLPDNKTALVSILTQGKANYLLTYAADIKDNQPSPLLQCLAGTAAPVNPTVSPDGTRVAFEVHRTATTDENEIIGIAVLPLKSGETLVVQNASELSKLPLIVQGRATRPQWSPDGTRLAYNLPSASGKRDVWVVNADGSNPRNLTNGKGDNAEPVWSPAK
jgi:TolB protein